MKILKPLSSPFIPSVITVLIMINLLQAQEKNSKQTQTSNKKGIAFKIPDGFMPGEIPPDKKGFMMLDPKKPAGMFVAYTPDTQSSEDFLLDLRSTFAR